MLDEFPDRQVQVFEQVILVSEAQPERVGACNAGGGLEKLQVASPDDQGAAITVAWFPPGTPDISHAPWPD
jgi:hypothetical protein